MIAHRIITESSPNHHRIIIEPRQNSPDRSPNSHRIIIESSLTLMLREVDLWMRNSRSLRRRPPPRVGEVRGGAATSFVGAACATGRALPPLSAIDPSARGPPRSGGWSYGIPSIEVNLRETCAGRQRPPPRLARGVQHLGLPQGEWHAAPSYTWGGNRLNASTKRVSSGGLPSTARLGACRRRLAPL